MENLNKQMGDLNKISRFSEDLLVGYTIYCIVDGELKSKLIPKELKEAFVSKFGEDLINGNEEKWKEIEDFLNQAKN
jgi:hypothetical protein